MNIGILIGVLIAVVVGVTLIPSIMSSTDESEVTLSEVGVEEEEDEIGGTAGALIDVLPIIFIAMVLLGAVAWIGAQGTWSIGTRVSSSSSPTRTFQRPLISQSSLPLESVLQRLGFTRGTGAPSWFPFSRPLGLLKESKGITLNLRSSLTWLVLEKHPDYETYLLVGISPDTTQEIAYLLGRDKDTQEPYYRKLPPGYAYGGLQAGINWCEEKDIQAKQSVFGRHG